MIKSPREVVNRSIRSCKLVLEAVIKVSIKLRELGILQHLGSVGRLQLKLMDRPMSWQ